MPKGLHHRVIPLLLAALVFALWVGVSAPAFAALEDTPTVSSETNPSSLEGDTSWRWGWGNTLYPQAAIGDIPYDLSAMGEQIHTDGVFYTFSTDPTLFPAAGSPHLSASPEGSMMTGTFDVYAAMDEMFGPGTWAPEDCQGMWYFRWMFYNQFRAANNNWMMPMGIDMTDPLPVENLTAGVTPSTTDTGWTSETRRVLRWDPAPAGELSYDALSGAGGFSVSVDGTETAFVRNVAPDWDIEYWAASVNPSDTVLPQVSQVTVEDLPAGDHRIGVTVVDRATNRSETRYVDAKIDPDVPKVKITKPIAAGVGQNASFEASATDLGGIQSVVFDIDGTIVGSDATAPYTANASMVPFGSGSHVLTVTVTDMMGRTATDQRIINVDSLAPVLSSIAAGPSPFYPIEQDGIKDVYTLSYSTNEPATAVLQIRTEGGDLYKTLVAVVEAGTNSFVWDGKSETGERREGAFDWTLTLSDSAGNIAVPAMGSVSVAAQATPPTMTSTTNPGDLDDQTVNWRWNWGNSLYPQVSITGGMSGASGVWYLFDQLPSNIPPVGGPNLSGSPTGTMFSGTVDVAGMMEETGWTQQPGATKAGEGWWYMHYRAYNQFSSLGPVFDVPLGIDLTAPGPVENLVAGVTSTQPTTGWTTATRRVLRWTPKAYDALAGVGGFSISVNGAEKAFVKNVGPDAGVEWWASSMGVPDVSLPQVSTVTLEDLPAGSSTIGVTVVDRATNRSETRYVSANIDPDTPAVVITAPVATVLGKSATISADASDQGGIKQVVFKVDGTIVATDSTAPYSTAVNLVPFGTGSHAITVTAYDMLDRAVTATKYAYCDVTTPTLSSVKGGPSPFYPKKRNKYRDDYIVKFKSSEPGLATLIFKTSKGTTFKTIKKSVRAGTTSIKWNGKSGGNNLKEGTYTWTLTVTDQAGNVSSVKKGKATERFYQLVKVSKNKVKLVLR